MCQSHSLDWLWLALDALHSPSSWPSFQGSGFVDCDRHSDESTFSPWECRAFFGLSGNDDSSPVTAGRTAHISPRRMSVTVPVRISRATSELNCGFLGYTPSPELGHMDVRLAPEDFLVLASGPRELFVRYSRGGLRILFVAIHAPGATSPQCNSWWHHLRTRFGEYAAGGPVVLLGDFNTYFSVSLDGHGGDVVFHFKHEVASALLNILQDHRLWIPSTFSSCHSGPSDTGGLQGVAREHAWTTLPFRRVGVLPQLGTSWFS